MINFCMEELDNNQNHNELLMNIIIVIFLYKIKNYTLLYDFLFLIVYKKTKTSLIELFINSVKYNRTHKVVRIINTIKFIDNNPYITDKKEYAIIDDEYNYKYLKLIIKDYHKSKDYKIYKYLEANNILNTIIIYIVCEIYKYFPFIIDFEEIKYTYYNMLEIYNIKSNLWFFKDKYDKYIRFMECESKQYKYEKEMNAIIENVIGKAVNLI